MLTRVGNGIREDEDYSPNPDANAPPLVDGNTVTDFYIHGIYHNKHFFNATPWTISNNNLTADTAFDRPAFNQLVQAFLGLSGSSGGPTFETLPWKMGDSVGSFLVVKQPDAEAVLAVLRGTAPIPTTTTAPPTAGGSGSGSGARGESGRRESSIDHHLSFRGDSISKGTLRSRPALLFASYLARRPKKAVTASRFFSVARIDPPASIGRRIRVPTAIAMKSTVLRQNRRTSLCRPERRPVGFG